MQDVKPNIHILAENYMPAAQRYAAATNQIESLQRDVSLIKKVVAGHSANSMRFRPELIK